MDTRFTLSQIVDAVLGSSGGSVKTAQATCEKCGKPAMADSKLCRECAEKDLQKSENEETGTPESEKTSSARVTKLASAVEYIVQHPENIHPVLGRVKTAEAPPEVAKMGPGKGPNPTATNLMDALAGEQSTVTGEAKTKIPMKPKTEKAIPGDKQPANAMEDNLRDMKGPYPAEGPLKQASSVRDRYMRIMAKKAADAENPASIASGKTTALPENQPDKVKRPAEVTGQESLISSNQKAIDVTKREAKAVPKKRMAEVITEPAQKRSTDKILDENLGKKVVDQAGAKVASEKTAAARALLKKVASGGCTCNDEGTCGHCKVAARLKQRQNGQ